MPYIIENTQVVKGDTITTCSLLIKENRIDYIADRFNTLPYMRMNTTRFLLTPGHVFVDTTFSPNMPFPQSKQYFQEKFLQKGATTVLFTIDVNYERELAQKLNELRVGLLNCPIDYYLGVKIPLRALTPSLIRQCKKQKIPVVFIDLPDCLEALEEVQWGWIRDAVYGYYLPLVPIWESNNVPKRTLQKRENNWKRVMSENRISAIPYSLKENHPLDQNVLKKIGIYPDKGDIRIGGEVDYNLYDLEEIVGTSGEIQVNYHIHSPKITVHRNTIIKEGKKITFRPGFGNEYVVKIPGYFKAYF